MERILKEKIRAVTGISVVYSKDIAMHDGSSVPKKMVLLGEEKIGEYNLQDIPKRRVRLVSRDGEEKVLFEILPRERVDQNGVDITVNIR